MEKSPNLIIDKLCQNYGENYRNSLIAAYTWAEQRVDREMLPKDFNIENFLLEHCEFLLEKNK